MPIKNPNLQLINTGQSHMKKKNCQLCVPVLAEEEGEQGVLVHGRDNRIRQHSEGLEL